MVMTDENGQEFIMDKSGKKVQVFKNEYGESYVMDEHGNPKIIN